MMGLFDCVDDTVLVKKALLSVSYFWLAHFSHLPLYPALLPPLPQEICDSLEELCDHQYGRRLLLYLLSPRNRRHFSPQFVCLLSPGDNNQHRYRLCILVCS